MENKILVIVAKNITTEILDYYSKSFNNWDKVIVSPESNGDVIKGIQTYNDSDFLDFELVKSQLGGERVGWYYQQFLKYTIVLAYSVEKVLIIDGDSILRDDIEFNQLYTTGRAVPTLYKLFNTKLLGNDFGKEEVSYITNQMLFERSVLVGMLGKLGGEINWMGAIIDKLKQNPKLMFSEYQLYAEYLLQVRNVKCHKLKVFRRFDCISSGVHRALKKYDLIAYERQHKTGLMRYLRANFLYLFSKELG